MAINKKMFLLDTNILIHDPEAYKRFKDAYVGIPINVLEELDSFKREKNDRGRSAREAIRNLDSVREQGSLRDGVKLDSGSIIRVVFIAEDTQISIPLNINLADNEILLIALHMQHEGFDVELISKDLNMRVKADSLGIASNDYLYHEVSRKDHYKGWLRVQVPSIQLKKDPNTLFDAAFAKELSPNQFILLESQHNPHNYKVLRYLGNQKYRAVVHPDLKWPMEARNAQQLMALDLLFDDTIQFISLVGGAGTGKTFLALLAGLHQTLEAEMYKKMLVSRPIIPLGADVGYLPGDLQDKLHNWMQPVRDNMEFIVHSANVKSHLKKYQAEMNEAIEDGGKKKKHHHPKKAPKVLDNLDELIIRGKISLEAITYMRGRSIPYQFILIDEVQNLTPHEVKTLITRVGEGSKIVIAGDPFQIDAPYLDFKTNGLIVATERFKDERIFGSVFLETSERSELSDLAAHLL
jgi:PhoH-like ATPase